MAKAPADDGKGKKGSAAAAGTLPPCAVGGKRRRVEEEEEEEHGGGGGGSDHDALGQEATNQITLVLFRQGVQHVDPAGVSQTLGGICEQKSGEPS